MERGLPLLIKRVDHSLVLKEDVDDDVLAVVTGDMQGSAAKEVDNVHLETGHTHKTTKKTTKGTQRKKNTIPINATHSTNYCTRPFH